MNYYQFKQQIQNNLWHGEARRREQLDAILIPMVLPDGSRIFGIDVSHWNMPPVNLKRMVELYKLRFVIIKGCDGSVNSRYYFEHVAAAKLAGIPFGMYVWLYPASRVNMDAQVNAWHARAIVDPPPLGIFIDCEWTTYGGQAANPNALDLRAAHDKLKAKQGKPAITYTAKGYADTYLKGFDWSREELWIANYDVPAPALPLGVTEYTYWQFTSKWMFDGVNYDGNYFNGTEAEFTTRYGGAPSAIVDGYQQLRRFDSDVYLWRGIPSRVHVTNTGGKLETVSSAAKRLGADFAINGDGWDKTVPADGYHLPLSYAASDGVRYQPNDFDNRPWFHATRQNAFLISYGNADVYNQVSGTRYLVRDGLNVHAAATDPNYTEVKAPRTAVGYTRNDKLILCVVDGRSTASAGVTLKQLADIMLEAGAWYALELDGGGSSTLVKDGAVMNVPSDGAERAVVNHLLIYTGETTMTIGTAKSTTHELSIRPLHQTINSGTLIKIPVNKEVAVLEIWEAPETTALNNKNDLWVQVTYAGVTGWAALIHLGVRYGTYTPAVVEPPPPVENKPASFEAVLAAGSTITVRDANGVELWKGVA